MKYFLSVLCLVLISSSLLLAQGPGKIAGKVTDSQSGEPLIGANVIIVGSTQGAATDIEGNYYILDVRPGSYTLRFSYIGYQVLTISNVIVTSELTTELNAQLSSEAIAVPEVEIVAERPLVSKSATNAIITVRSEEIKNIPTRGYLDVVALQPGIVKLGNNLYVRGGRSDEVAYFIDGMIVNNPYNSTNAGAVVNESIEEVTYQAGGFSAEYGFANAGLVSATTKGGTERYTLSVGVISDEMFYKRAAPKDSLQFVRDGLQAPHGFRSYGTSTFHLSAGGPFPGVGSALRFHVGTEYTYALDGNPTVGRKFYLPNNTSKELTLNSNLIWDMKPFNVRVGGFTSFTDDRIPSQYHSVFNSERNLKRERSTHAYYLRGTHTLGASTFYSVMLSFFQTEHEQGDPVWFDDIDSYGDPVKNPVLSGPGRNPPNRFANLFAGPGFVNFAYEYNRSSYWSAKVDLTHQLDRSNLLKVGGEYRYNTIRYWSTLPARFALVKAASPTFTREEILRNSYTTNLGMAVDGVAKGRKTFLDDGSRNSAPHPIIAAIYAQNKLELSDLVLNIGLRWDYINANVDRIKDPTNIHIVSHPSGNYQMIAEDNFEPGEATTSFSPRLGFSFPVTDQTVFHAQYGHFIQHVELNRLYTSTTELVQEMTAGNYVTVGNPSLKPERTITYEVGFSQQIGPNASLDITTYYKDIRDLVQLRNVFANPVAYAQYTNGDFGTVKGLSFSFNLRRTNRVSAMVNYTLQYASGTGSGANTNFNIAWLGTNYPTFVSPLDFDQRHTGSVNLDFRTEPGDGPTMYDIKPLEQVGVNLLLTFGSGRPYTPARPNTILFGPAWEQPIAAMNQTYSPWNFQLDLKVDKTFSIGPATLNVYLWMLNVTNARNVTFVYNQTGLPNDDGYFRTTDGQAYAAENGQAAVDGYRYRLAAPGNYGTPRQTRLGLRVDF
ncbi:MAG: TonB-dependent receptor [Ignavibacterium sp.]|jgi:outer membrane receptor protein involved in Fe transport